MDHASRQQGIEQVLERSELGALLVTHSPNVSYLCGFTGSAGALLLFSGGKPKPILFTDGRYTSQAKAEVQRARVVTGKRSALVVAATYFGQIRGGSLGVEAEHMPLANRSLLRKTVGGKTYLRETTGLIERARMIKDAAELEIMTRAAELGTRLLDVVLAAIRPGVRESEVAAELEYAARKAGASAMSFETIVASGERSALPHGVATTAAIPSKGFIVLDFGVRLAGYCSDMTRTVYMGRCGAAERHMYEAVRQAQMAAAEKVRSEVAVEEVDAAARKILIKSGLGRYFTHSTGHGVGLEIHEPPRLGRGQKERLKSGMVVTLEPGVYLPCKGGVRIEDMVVVTETGHKVLTPAPKELIEL